MKKGETPMNIAIKDDRYRVRTVAEWLATRSGTKVIIEKDKCNEKLYVQ